MRRLRRGRRTAAWHELYYKDNDAKLQQVRKTYDPRNFFHHSQSGSPPLEVRRPPVTTAGGRRR
ncbi:BBE domain-containing protein [Streptomyces sp. NPDC002740]